MLSRGSDPVELVDCKIADMTAMALEELGECAQVGLTPWRCAGDGTQILAPRLGGQALLLNLTPKEDDWLTVRAGFDYTPILKHHGSCDTTCFKLHFVFPHGTDLHSLEELDKRVQRLGMDGMDSVGRNGCNWLPLLRSGSGIIGNVVVDHSDAPTRLHFLTDAGVESGEGVEFFTRAIGALKFEDFRYKALVELQFVEVRDENSAKSMKLAVKVHSLVFAPPAPKETVVSHTVDELEGFVRASKKVRRL